MSIEQVKQHVQQLPPQAWQELSAWMMHDERIRREQEASKAEVIQQLQEEGTIPAPDYTTRDGADSAPAWVDPGTDHAKMYPEGAVVTHAGKTWVSVTSALNSWEPGTENGLTWREITPAEAAEDPETGETITQWRPGIAVTAGMKLTYNGATYEVIQPHTTQADWLPDALPTLYKKL